MTKPSTPFFIADDYNTPEQTPNIFARFFPSVSFYIGLLNFFMSAGWRAKHGVYTGADWAQDSLLVMRHLERVGCHFQIQGLDVLEKVSEPCVFAANHMGTLETMCLAAMIQPYKDVTFVIKQSLLNYPLLKHILLKREPITLERTNPREDLKKVLETGVEKLNAGTSIIIFPQSTRSLVFDARKFNSIAVKLAKKAGVPVVPLALKTDAWSGGGALLSDFGKIYPQQDIYFRFGEALSVNDNPKQAQEHIVHFIHEQLNSWCAQCVALPAKTKEDPTAE